MEIIRLSAIGRKHIMLPGPASEKVSWNPVLITIGLGILLAIISFVVVTSQWGRPTTSVATVGFFGILFGILIFAIGCIWLIVKIMVVVSRSRQNNGGVVSLTRTHEATNEELDRLGPEEKEQLQTDALKQFGLPPLATLRIWAREAVIFTLIGAVLMAIAARSPMAGLTYGSVFGLGIWTVYRLLRFALT
jgi:hypothetical protein